jgi:phosphatidylglycerol:prolipoprotein diacylglycerol transferase
MVTWHGLLTAAGVLVSVYAARHYARRFGLDANLVWTLAPYIALAAIVGGRLAYIGANPAEFRLAPWEVLRIDRGGLASFGALGGALAALYAFGRKRRLPVWRLADALAIAIPINYLFMRVGNFLIGELYGDVTSLPWAATIPGVAGPRHPVPLYDALAQAALIVFFIRRARSIPFEGFLLWWTLFYVSVVRFTMDLFRSEWRAVGFLTLGQIGALVLAALSAALVLLLRRRAVPPPLVLGDTGRGGVCQPDAGRVDGGTSGGLKHGRHLRTCS